MTNPFIDAIIYVASDQYFTIAMALTMIMGMFISAAIYDGETKEIKKFLISMGAYVSLILMTTYARVVPNLYTITPSKQYMTFAGTVTIVLVTIFYLLGMCLGILITRLAHKGGEEHNGQ